MLGAMGITLWTPTGPEAAAAAPASTVAEPPARPHAADPPRPRATSGTPSADPDIASSTGSHCVSGWRASRLPSCSRTQTVFGVGHPQAHCMIVGEAPGENEDLQGEPFVGAAGQLLDRMLRAIGLTRGQASAAQQVYIANTLKCRPPRNRNPEPDELARCSAYLHRQIELVQPRVLLAMGRFAVQALLDSSEPIGRLRGRVHRWRDVPVVVTYHPAYLLRNPADKARAWADLCLAAAQLST